MVKICSDCRMTVRTSLDYYILELPVFFFHRLYLSVEYGQSGIRTNNIHQFLVYPNGYCQFRIQLVKHDRGHMVFVLSCLFSSRYSCHCTQLTVNRTKNTNIQPSQPMRKFFCASHRGLYSIKPINQKKKNRKCPLAGFETHKPTQYVSKNNHR